MATMGRDFIAFFASYFFARRNYFTDLWIEYDDLDDDNDDGEDGDGEHGHQHAHVVEKLLEERIFSKMIFTAHRYSWLLLLQARSGLAIQFVVYWKFEF